MSRNLPTHPTKRHPLTGLPLEAVGILPSGRVVWPIMGGDSSNDPPERPEDVPEETWDALGDPGKAALVRERTARVQAERDRDSAVRERDAARARPAPPKRDTTTEPAKTDDGPDIADIVKQAVAAAIKPFEEREQHRTAEEAAGKVRTAVLDAAKDRLVDATDALQIDLATVLDDNGAADPAKVTKAIDDLLTAKPHLAKTTVRFAPPGIGGAAATGQTSQKEQVAAILAGMQTSTGVRPPATTS